MRAIASAEGPGPCVMGVHPNFMSMTPTGRVFLLRRALQRAAPAHAGQGDDFSQNDRFFSEVGLPPPDVSLDVRTGSQVSQVGVAMKRLEMLPDGLAPSRAMAVDDVNSMPACSLVAITVSKGVPGDLCVEECRHGPTPRVGSTHVCRADFAQHGNGSPSPVRVRAVRAQTGEIALERTMAASRMAKLSRRLGHRLACNLGRLFLGIETGRAA